MSEKAKGALMLIIGLVMEILCIRAVMTDGEGMNFGMGVFMLICAGIAIGGFATIMGNTSTESKPLKTNSTQKNAGTRYINEKQATSAWFGQHMNNDTPVIICRYETLEQAKGAILSLSFIKEVGSQLISTEAVDYGYYPIKTGKSEVIVCGHGFKYDKFIEAKEKLTKLGGKIYSEKAPVKKAAASKPSAKSGVKFIGKSSKELATGINATYMSYTASSENEALEFLNKQSVTQQLYYIVVDTPDGAFGKDLNGIYKE